MSGGAGGRGWLYAALAELRASRATSHFSVLLLRHPAPAGADRQRKRLLKTVPVVGITCCGAMLATLEGHQVGC